MARKGILVTDPSVARMSRAQWVWEYLAIRRREEHEREFSIKSMKAVLVSVLGLNLAPPTKPDGSAIPAEELTDDQRESFIPLVMLAGNTHLMQPYFTKIKKALEGSGDDETGKSSVPIDEFEKMSRMVADTGDMVPIDPLAGVDVNEIIRKQTLKNLGVKIIEDVPSIGGKKHTANVSVQELDDGE